MPIVSIQNQINLNKGIPEFGALRLGSPKRKNKNGKDIFGTNLSHFRVDFKANYGYLAPFWNECFASSQGKPDRLEVRLVGKSVDDVFPYWYKAGNSTQLLHMCDGVTQHLYWDDIAKKHLRTPIACEGGEPDFKCGCRRSAELHVTVPVFNEYVKKMGKFRIPTSSIHNINRIVSQLTMLYEATGNLHFVPVIIGRVTENKTFPTKDGRSRRDFDLLYMEFDTALLQRYLADRAVPELADNLNALPETTNGNGNVPELPDGLLDDDTVMDADIVDADTSDLDVSKMVEFLHRDNAVMIPAVDLYQFLTEQGIEAITPENKLMVIALVVEYWFTDETGRLQLDDAAEAVNKLLGGEPLEIVMNYIVGEPA